jgi:CubicO group peptidase (beta-lactamase class C family)
LIGLASAAAAALASSFSWLLLREPAREGLAGEIDAIAQEAIENGPVAGISVAVARRGQLIHEAGYGLADLENRLPTTPTTVYRVGSITKQFTAAAVMKLVEEERVRLEAPVTTYLPDYPAPPGVTVASLLNHTSGVKNYTTMEKWWETMALEMAPDRLAEVFRDEPLDFSPGDRFSYSNSGYALLGLLVERVSGMPFGSYLHGEVFAPLGLAATSYCDYQVLVPNRAHGYKVVDGGFVNASYVSMSQAYAAGAVCSSATDLVRWFQGLAGGALLSEETYELMTTPARLTDGSEIEYGYGLAVSFLEGRRRINHVGGTLGFSSQISHYEDEDVTIVVLTNTEGANAASIESDIARVVLGLGDQTTRDILLTPAELDRYVGTYDLELTTVRVSASEGRLYAVIDAPGLEGRYGLLYQGDDTFQAEADPELTLQFPDTPARTDGFVLVRHGITMRARRVEPEP